MPPSMLSAATTAATGLAALLAVLALVVLGGRALRWGRHAARASPQRLLGVEESLALDPRRRLHVVRCGARRVLLLTGGGQDLVVGWLAEERAP